MEGAEAFAFRGARQTLARFPSVILIMEVNVDRMGAAKAAVFYRTINELFPVMRRIGDAGRIVPVSQKVGAAWMSCCMLWVWDMVRFC